MQEILDVLVVCLQVLRSLIPLCYKGSKKILNALEKGSGARQPDLLPTLAGGLAIFWIGLFETAVHYYSPDLFLMALIND